jgi:hypothetical protein
MRARLDRFDSNGAMVAVVGSLADGVASTGMAAPDPSALLREWQQALRRLGSLPLEPEELAERLRAPMEVQARLVEQALEQQLAYQRDLNDRILKPLMRFREVLDEVAGSMRTQATAIRRTSESLQEVADLLDGEASLIKQGSGAIGEGAQALRSAFARAPDEGPPPT